MLKFTILLVAGILLYTEARNVDTNKSSVDFAYLQDNLTKLLSSGGPHYSFFKQRDSYVPDSNGAYVVDLKTEKGEEKECSMKIFSLEAKGFFHITLRCPGEKELKLESCWN